MVPPPDDDDVLRDVTPPLPTDDERDTGAGQMTSEQHMQILMTEQDDMLEDMEDADEDVNGSPPNVFPAWLIAAGAGFVVAVLTILGIVTLIDAPSRLSPEDAQAHALWIDYSHAVTTVGGGSTGNGGRNTGRSACPGSSPGAAARAKCHLTVLFAEPCLRVLALVNGRVVGRHGWHDCKEPDPGVYDGLAWSASRTTADGRSTNLLGFRFAPEPEGGTAHAGGCRVSACSESQVASTVDYSDYSTDYCALRNLYADANLTSTETLTDCRQHDLSACCKFHDCDDTGACH